MNERKKTSEGSERINPPALPSGTLLGGRYSVGKVLGSGGFGITYIAYDQNHERTLAVKEYYPAGLAMRCPDGISVEVMSTLLRDDFEYGKTRFLKESELLSDFIGCGSIASVYDSFCENGTAYSVMEYVNGITLFEYSKTEGALSAGEAVYVMKRAAKALQALHSEGILHRDISPENIMLCKNGGVKLIDFGTARQLLSDASNSFTAIINPAYAPLEQYGRKLGQDGRTDIYSLGASMFYLMTLEEPADAMSRADDDGDFKRAVSKLPREAAKIIAKCAAVRREERYLSAKELLETLKNCSITERRPGEGIITRLFGADKRENSIINY